MILPTPFSEDEQVDEASLERLVGHALDAGVAGVTVLGVMGEADKLTDAERLTVVRRVVGTVAGRVPVVAGATQAGTHTTIALGEQLLQAGATGLMVAPAAGARGHDAIFRHFAAIAEHVAAPLVVQDHPASSGVVMSAALLAELWVELAPVVAIKLEDPPTPAKLAAVLAMPGAAEARIFGGLGGVQLFSELERGAVGTMTGFAFPEGLVEIVTRYRAGDVPGAWEAYRRYLPLMVYEAQPVISLAVRKELLRQRGWLTHASLRAPAPALTATAIQEAEGIVARWGQHGESRGGCHAV